MSLAGEFDGPRVPCVNIVGALDLGLVRVGEELGARDDVAEEHRAASEAERVAGSGEVAAEGGG